MDFFGIGSAVKGAAEIYFRSARRTGKTIQLLNGLKDGDRVYFATGEEARHFERLCKERNREIECVVIPTKHPGKVFDRGTSQGRAVFDHGWVEKFYREQLEAIGKDIHDLETQSSGYGEAHEQTKMQALELAKWRT